jgi:rare lipoprotein A (peptidoglycan hydrolase)
VSLLVLASCTPSPRYVASRSYESPDAASPRPETAPKGDSEKTADTAVSLSESGGVAASFDAAGPDTSVPPSSWEAASGEPQPRKMSDTAVVWSQRGKAAWYGPGFEGRKTASGERFDSRKFTAAHKTLPFGSVVRVTNLGNGLSVTVRVNDRGPFNKNRIIDLSRAAARVIELDKSGVADVVVDMLRESAP